MEEETGVGVPDELKPPLEPPDSGPPAPQPDPPRPPPARVKFPKVVDWPELGVLGRHVVELSAPTPPWPTRTGTTPLS